MIKLNTTASEYEKKTQVKRLALAPEVANFLNVSIQRVYELARNNQLPGTIRLGERQYRFDLEVIAEHIQKGAA